MARPLPPRGTGAAHDVGRDPRSSQHAVRKPSHLVPAAVEARQVSSPTTLLFNADIDRAYGSVLLRV